jgi:hypothetical protein
LRRAAVQEPLAGGIVFQVGQATPAHQALFGHQRDAVNTHIWCAVSTYVLIAIVKKELHLEASLNTLLQILSVSVFVKTQFSCGLHPGTRTTEIPPSANKLNLFTFKKTLLIFFRSYQSS